MLMCFGILQCNVPSRSRVALVGWAASREKGVCAVAFAAPSLSFYC